MSVTLTMGQCMALNSCLYSSPLLMWQTDRQLNNNPVKKSHGTMCVEYGGWQICGMWCLTKNCCTSWAECSRVPWDKLHWHLYHAQILLKPPSKKECPDPALFSNWLISSFLSPHLKLQLSLQLILFGKGCLVCSSLSMNMQPSFKWQNCSKRGYESRPLLKSNFITSYVLDPVLWSSVQNLIYRQCYIFLDIADMMCNTNTTAR